MKVKYGILSFIIILLVACSKSPVTHTFVGEIEGMTMTSEVVVEGDKILTEHLTYDIPYEVVGIKNDAEALERADVEKDSFTSLFEGVEEEAANVTVAVDEDKNTIVMSIDLNYEKEEYIDQLTRSGFLESGRESDFVSFKKTKEQYEASGLKEEKDTR